MNDEFSEILDPKDFAEENPTTIDKSEKTFVSEFLKGASLEAAAEAAGMDYVYALKLVRREDIARLIQSGTDAQIAATGEVQKREGLNMLSDVIRTRPLDYVDDDGEFLIHKMKENNVPVKSIELKRDKDGCVVGQKIGFHDHLQAFKMLADTQGWNAPAKVEHSGFIGGLTPDILKKVDEVVVDAEVIEDEEKKEDIKKRLLS